MKVHKNGPELFFLQTGCLSPKPANDLQLILEIQVADEIKGGNTVISDGFTTEEARDMANILNSSTLPFRLVVIGEEITE